MEFPKSWLELGKQTFQNAPPYSVVLKETIQNYFPMTFYSPPIVFTSAISESARQAIALFTILESVRQVILEGFLLIESTLRKTFHV